MEIRRARKSSVSMLPVRFYSDRVKRRKRRESRPQRAETESACRDGEEEEGKPRRAGRKGGEREAEIQLKKAFLAVNRGGRSQGEIQHGRGRRSVEGEGDHGMGRKKERREVNGVCGRGAARLGTCRSFSTSYPKLMRQALNSSGPRAPPWSCAAAWGEAAPAVEGGTRGRRHAPGRGGVGRERDTPLVEGTLALLPRAG